MKKTIVVARYAEPLDWLARVPEDWQIEIVNKGEILAPFPLEALSARTYWTMAENVGREGGTFLRAIERARAEGGDPDDLFAFLQGKPEDHVPEAPELLAIEPNGDFRELGRTFLCDAKGMPHHWEPLPLAESFEFVFERKAPERFRFIVGAQFLARRSLLAVISEAELRRATMLTEETPAGPWVMERLWMYLLRCDER